MNKKIFSITVSITLAFSCRLCLAQTAPGFVQQEAIKIPGQTTDAQLGGLTPAQKQSTRSYFDGLGRTVQTIGIQASPLQNDLIQPVVYDNLGRQTTGYLPYAGKATDVTASYRPNAISTDQPAFYAQTGQYIIPQDGAPYSQQVFENSPLQRMLEAGMDGSGFQPNGTGTQHYKTVSYRPNNATADGAIIQWGPDGTKQATNYNDNSLSVMVGTDEDSQQTQSFTDLAGRVILKRQILSSGNLDTYYIYNNAGMVKYIIPPRAIISMTGSGNYNIFTQPAINSQLFIFAYNSRGQLTNKTVPGKGMMNIVYDPLNRPVLMQDANLAANFNWNYIKYDSKGRAISQGIYADPNHYSQADMQTAVSALNYSTAWYESRSTVQANGFYTNNIFPTIGLTPLAYSFYDDYDLNDDGTADYSYAPASLPGEVGATTAQLKGMPTMVLQSRISDAAPVFLLSVTFYDHNLHTIQVRSNNLVDYSEIILTDAKTTVPDFTGMPTVSKTSVKTSSSTTNYIQTTLTYDHMYRVTAVTQQYNAQTPVQVAAYVYNELGQQIAKRLGVNGSSWLQQVDFRYNIRGQLLSINNSKLNPDGGATDDDGNAVFGMQLFYDNTDSNLGNTPCFNGKVSAVKWMSRDGSNVKSNERAYKYTYDGVGRYRATVYYERSTTGTGAFSKTDGWDELVSAYDPNGNIAILSRNATTQGSGTYTPIDNLTYAYSSTNPNQLYTVTDATGNQAGFGIQTGGNAAGHYQYDANGNLITDPYKAISLYYNVINRTDKIVFTGVTGQIIYYTYDPNGNVLRKQEYSGGALQTTTDYISGFVYITTAGGTATFAYAAMAEGRVVNTAGTLAPEYIISDQQGNARISFNNTGAGGTAKVVQENSYYGLGMVMPNSPVSTTLPIPNKNLYNGGSEWQNTYANNMPDYYQTNNRNYDPEIGRFIGVDPMAENVANMTTYQYAGNNPVSYNDPMGNLKRYPQQVVPIAENDGDLKAEGVGDYWGDSAYGDGGGGGGGGYGGGGGFGGIPNADRSDFTEYWDSTRGWGAGYSHTGGNNPPMGAATAANGVNYEFDKDGHLISKTPNGLGENFFVQMHETDEQLQNGGTPWTNIKTWSENISAPEALELLQGDVANQRGTPAGSGYDLNPNSVGHNYFSSVYIGPDNPISYNRRKYYYNIAPKDRADAAARQHDLGYDAVKATGISGVLFDTDALPADLKLIGSAFSLFANPFNGATLSERTEGFLIYQGIGTAIAPKAVIYLLSQSDIKN